MVYSVVDTILIILLFSKSFSSHKPMRYYYHPQFTNEKLRHKTKEVQ